MDPFQSVAEAFLTLGSVLHRKVYAVAFFTGVVSAGIEIIAIRVALTLAGKIVWIWYAPGGTVIAITRMARTECLAFKGKATNAVPGAVFDLAGCTDLLKSCPIAGDTTQHHGKDDNLCSPADLHLVPRKY